MRTIKTFRKTAAGTAAFLAAFWPISQATARNADLDNVELPIQNYAVIDLSGSVQETNDVTGIAFNDDNQVAFGYYSTDANDNPVFHVKKWRNGETSDAQAFALKHSKPSSDPSEPPTVDAWYTVGHMTAKGLVYGQANVTGDRSPGNPSGGFRSFVASGGSVSLLNTPSPLLLDLGHIATDITVEGANDSGYWGIGGGAVNSDYLKYGAFFFISSNGKLTAFDGVDGNYFTATSEIYKPWLAAQTSLSSPSKIASKNFRATGVNANGWAIGHDLTGSWDAHTGYNALTAHTWSIWDGTNLRSLQNDTPVDLNDQNQVVVQGYSSIAVNHDNSQDGATEGYLWESPSNQTIFANKLPLMVVWQIQHTQPFSLSNQGNPADPSANPDGSIQILADAGNLGKLVPADASGKEKYLWTRDNAGEWTTSHIKLPEGTTITDWNTINKNGLIAALGQPPGATTTHALLLFPAEIVSRDKFVAGSLEIPEGLDDLELEFVNAATQENLGSYGQLLGGGSTQIYDAVTDILNTSDVDYGGQPDDQQVFFVRDPKNNRKINFYTCFNAVGEVQIKMRINGKQVGVIKHQLAAASDFANWITYVDNWVKGDGFDFSDPISARSVGTPSTGPPRTLRVGPAPQNAAGAELSNLTRACLIPIFNVVAQTEGMEAVALGTFEGVKTGLKDDWAMVKLIKMGAVSGGNWAADSVESELRKWGSDPLKRAGELKQITDRFCEEMIFKPLADLGEASSTWEGFKKKAWGTWDRIKGGAQKAWAITQGNASKLVDGLGSWVDDFNGRMIQGGERVAFQNTPWATDRLLNDFRQAGRQVAYTTGYVFGYCCEQAGIGALTGGSIKFGQVLVKGGVSLATELATRTTFAIGARCQLLKKTLASAAVSIELHRAIERGLVEAAKTPLSDTIKESAGEVIESALARDGFDRAVCNLGDYMLAATSNPRTREWAVAHTDEWSFLLRAASVASALGDQFTAKAAKNWLKLMENSLPLQESDLDRISDFLTVFRTNTTSGRMWLKESLEGADAQTPALMLEEGFKVSPRIKDVYTNLYHYADADTLLKHATPSNDGYWILKEKEGGRYVTTTQFASQTDSKSALQLPKPREVNDALTGGRFKCIIQTANVADDLRVPAGWKHEGSQMLQWLELLVQDNPERGLGGPPQFTQFGIAKVQVIDLRTGNAVSNMSELQAALTLP